jgi:hypothetical protein
MANMAYTRELLHDECTALKCVKFRSLRCTHPEPCVTFLQVKIKTKAQFVTSKAVAIECDLSTGQDKTKSQFVTSKAAEKLNAGT